jgi:hypothetical protein
VKTLKLKISKRDRPEFIEEEIDVNEEEVSQVEES